MGTAIETYWSLVDKAEKKFSRLRDLPLYGGNKWDSYFIKAFQVYTKLWKFQQENRQSLVESGLKRWEIGEIASRIGQLYYNYYMRTSDVTYLSESYTFYEAIVNREYFKDTGKDVVLSLRQLRFYARFIVVSLLLNRREMVLQLSRQLKALVEEHHRNFQANDSNEWKRVVQDMNRFIKADSFCQNSRPLRYSVLLDPQPNSFPAVEKLGKYRVLHLKDAVIASYYHNEVKFSELTLDTFRILQCLEWEPSGTFYRSRAQDSNGVTAGHSGNVRMDEIMDQSLPPNPHKYVLYRPSVMQILLMIATACEELPADGIIFLYLTALEKQVKSSAISSSFPMPIVSSKVGAGIAANLQHYLPSSSSGKTEELTLEGSDISPPSSPDHAAAALDMITKDIVNSDAGLWFGPRGSKGLSHLYPADLIPYTRRPLFIIIDSNKSALFEAIHGEERGEPAAIILSPALEPVRKLVELPTYYHKHHKGAGRFFTFFLTAPFVAFCQLVNVSLTSLAQGTSEQVQKVLTTTVASWGDILCDADLDIVWLRIMWDPFLRQMLLRFIFCRACLSLHRDYGTRPEYLPRCLPALPKEVHPTETVIQECIYQISSSLGVEDQFAFTVVTPKKFESLKIQKS